MSPLEQEAKTGADAYNLWAARIQTAIFWRANLWNGDALWKRAYRDYKGMQWNEMVDEGQDKASDNPADQITINILASQIMTLAPFLVNTNPEYKGKARKPDGYVSSMIQEAVLNYECDRKKVFDQLLKSVYDDLIIGHGVAKTGFTRKIDEATLAAAGDIVYEDYIADESVYAKRVRPFDFFFDPNASERNLETARWCCERYYKYATDVAVNDAYKSSVTRKLRSGEYKLNTKNLVYPEYSSDQVPGYPSGATEETYINPESELAILYEIWDKKHNKYYVFADGVPEPLLEARSPYDYLKGEFPYKKVDFVLLPDEWYGVGVHYMIQDQAYELNRHRTFSFHHRRRFSARKYEALNSIENDELEKLAGGEDGAYIKVPATGSVKPIEDVPMPQDYILVEQLIKADIETMTGVDQLIRGGQLPSRTTAGEVGTRVNVFTSKLAHKIKSVDDFYLGIGMQLNTHIAANYSRSQVVRVVGAQGEFFVEYSPQDLKDEIIIEMETISAPKYDPAVDKNQRIQLFQIIAQMWQTAMQAGQQLPINFQELFKWVIEAFDYKDIGRFFAPANQPIQPPQVITSSQLGQQLPQQQTMNSQDLLRQISGQATAAGGQNGNPSGI